MTNLYLDGVPTRRAAKSNEYVADGFYYDEQDNEMPVLVTFYYTPSSPDQTNPDRPNPGPGHESGIELMSVTRKSDGREIEPLRCDFDESEFIEAVKSRSGMRFEDVAWLKKMAGL